MIITFRESGNTYMYLISFSDYIEFIASKNLSILSKLKRLSHDLGSRFSKVLFPFKMYRMVNMDVLMVFFLVFFYQTFKVKYRSSYQRVTEVIILCFVSTFVVEKNHL